jgi:hypothetical protein
VRAGLILAFLPNLSAKDPAPETTKNGLVLDVWMRRWHRRLGAIVSAVAPTLSMIAAVCLFVAPAHAVEEEARVLMLNGLNPDLPIYRVTDDAIRAHLAGESPRRMVFYSESLDSQRFSLQALEPSLLELLAKKYSALRIDVVVAVSRAAHDFFQRHGERIWPGARLVYVGGAGEVMVPAALPDNSTAVQTDAPMEGTIDIARLLQPDARAILVISGVSDLGKQEEELARKVLSRRGDGFLVGDVVRRATHV